RHQDLRDQRIRIQRKRRDELLDLFLLERRRLPCSLRVRERQHGDRGEEPDDYRFMYCSHVRASLSIGTACKRLLPVIRQRRTGSALNAAAIERSTFFQLSSE